MLCEELDVAIFGGGIAGLWLLARLRRQGYICRLFETRALGSGQTLASQGILHGGVKYALDGVINRASRTISAMPERWRHCLDGSGELDLREVGILTDHQHLWTSRQLSSRIAGFFSGKALQGMLEPVPGDSRPAPFDHPAFRGDLYRLHETVLDVPSLVATLARQGRASLTPLDPDWRIHRTEGGVQIDTAQGSWRARRAILAAGEGNPQLLSQLGLAEPRMQLRPLHMAVVEGQLPPLYGHSLGSGPLPRFTVTSHPGERGRVWYLGGELAESGVDRSPQQQIGFALRELRDALPWIPFDRMNWRTRRIARAEVATSSGRRPDGIAVHRDGPLITVWPTKLVLAPALGDAVLGQLQRQGIEPGGQGAGLAAVGAPEIDLPWWRKSP
jgi:glycine/D-amino acid oxidase-like deaminating enzyme